jgi:hypothetical protein
MARDRGVDLAIEQVWEKSVVVISAGAAYAACRDAVNAVASNEREWEVIT